MQKDSKTLFSEGFEHYEKGDLQAAADCFRAAGEQGHQMHFLAGHFILASVEW